MKKIKSGLKLSLDKMRIPIILLCLVLLLKLPTLLLPYHWDELLFVGYAKYFSVNGFLSTPPDNVGHVRLFPWILATAFLAFGESVFISHIITVFFAFLGVCLTYLIAKEIFSKRVGIVAALLLFLSPIYFAMSGQALLDMPLTAMMLATFYFAMKKKIWLYLIFGVATVLTKEPGIILIGSIALYQLLKHRSWKKMVVYGLPMIAFLIWILFMGSFYEPRTYTTPVIIEFAQRLAAQIYQIFFWNYAWLPTVLIAVAIYKKKFEKNIEPLFPLMLSSALMIIVFSIPSDFTQLLPRYLLSILPLYFIFAAYSIESLFKNFKNKKLAELVVLIVIIALFVSCYRYNWGLKGFLQDPVFHSTLLHEKYLASVVSGELSMDYVDIVESEKQMVDFVFENYLNSKIVASVPIVNSISLKANIGYSQWDAHNITILYPPSKEKISQADFLIYEPYAPLPQDINEEIAKMDLIKKFDNNQASISLYKIKR
jgi:4-amino-4-deoxy-L-arabinose transferase-like glycosyltransferase